MEPHGLLPIEALDFSGVDNDEQQDKDLLELLQMLDNTTPVIPDTLMDYFMAKAGVECDDVRLLVALIGQKFITDIANDAMHFSRLRQSGTASTATAASASGASFAAGRAAGKKNTLTLEDLAAALTEYGINVKRPSYYT